MTKKKKSSSRSAQRTAPALRKVRHEWVVLKRVDGIWIDWEAPKRNTWIAAIARVAAYGDASCYAVGRVTIEVLR